mgnify:FL=1
MERKVLFGVLMLVVMLAPIGVVFATGLEAEGEPLKGVLAFPVFDNDATKMRYNIYVMDLETGKRKLLKENASQPAFSHDGKSLAYKDWTENQDVYGLYAASIADMRGTGWRFGESIADQRPQWSPDDAFFYYYSRKESDRLDRVMVTESAWSKGRTILRPDMDNKEILGHSPAVLLVKKDTYDILYQGCEFANCGVIRRHLNGTTPKLVDGDTTARAMSVSPDSQWIAFMSYNRDNNWEIYVMAADGSKVTRLTNNPAVDGLPTWSPDGAWVAFVRETKAGSNNWDIMAVRPDGTGEQKLAELGLLDGRVKGTTPDQCGGWLEEQISWGTVMP